MTKVEQLERYEKLANYLNNQTDKEWQKLKAYVLSTLDFEERLEMSKDEDLY